MDIKNDSKIETPGSGACAEKSVPFTFALFSKGKSCHRFLSFS